MRATIIVQQQHQQQLQKQEKTLATRRQDDQPRGVEPPQHIPPILHSNCKNVPFAAIKPNDTTTATTKIIQTIRSRETRTTTTTNRTKTAERSKRRRRNAIAGSSETTSNANNKHRLWYWHRHHRHLQHHYHNRSIGHHTISSSSISRGGSSCCRHCEHKKYYETFYKTTAAAEPPPSAIRPTRTQRTERPKAMRLKENLIRSSRNGRRMASATTATTTRAASHRRNLNMLTSPRLSRSEPMNTNSLASNACRCCQCSVGCSSAEEQQQEEAEAQHQNYVNLLSLSYGQDAQWPERQRQQPAEEEDINFSHQLQYQQRQQWQWHHNDVIDLINYDDDYRISRNNGRASGEQVSSEEDAAQDIDCYYNSNKMTNSCLVINTRSCGGDDGLMASTAVAPASHRHRRNSNATKLRNPQLVMLLEDMQSEPAARDEFITITAMAATTTPTLTRSCGNRLQDEPSATATTTTTLKTTPTTMNRSDTAGGNARNPCLSAALECGDDKAVATAARDIAGGGGPTADYDFDYYYKEISQTTTLLCSNSSSCSVGCITACRRQHSIRCNKTADGSRCCEGNSGINRATTTIDQDVDAGKGGADNNGFICPALVAREEANGHSPSLTVATDKGIPLERVMRTNNAAARGVGGAGCYGDGSCRSGKYHNKEMELTAQGGDAAAACRHRHRRRWRRELHDLLPVLGKMQFANSWAASSATTLRLLFTILAVFSLTTSVSCWAGRQDVPSNCTFPARWEGSWFLSGYQQSIHIKGSQFSYRGRCAASDGNKYLIVDEKGCHRCLVIYEKHKNVLQYKESECEGDSLYLHQTNPSAMAMHSVVASKQQTNSDHRGGAHPNTNTNMNMNMNTNNGHSRLSSSDQYIMRSNDDMNDYFCKGRETLQNLCDQIPGDALLYSLFRESAEPVKCPLRGPFVFTYNRGHGECKNPVSNIESCTEESRLLLSFQACHDVQGTESTVEELTCLATWKDGNSRYLVGLVSHHHAISNEERYRCFVYEKISPLLGGPAMISTKDAEYKLAQSGDATCNGLDSAEVGSRIMSLRKPPLAVRCDFPAWFKGPRHWHALMGNAIYNYHSNDGSVQVIKSNGYMETRALCEQINKQTATEMMAVVHYTTGCQSGFMCMMFYRRDTHVIEIQTGKQAVRLEDACAPDHFDVHKMPYITLLANNPDPQICPMEGLYNLRGAIGPPYQATRHKRNHSNKLHGLHGHHHHSAGGAGGDPEAINSEGKGLPHKSRRGTLSFRNAERSEHSSWHANTRGLPVRSRRDAIPTTTTTTTTTTQSSNPSTHGEEAVASSPQPQAAEEIQAETMLSKRDDTAVGSVKGHDAAAAANGTQVTFLLSEDLSSDGGAAGLRGLRSRRDAPVCITNYKAQRQLLVGCTEPNVIDVRPMCTDSGDEEYLCHGSWSENGTVYIIARHKGTPHAVCISYRPTEGSSAKLVIGDACYRGTQKPPEHHIVANLSVFGKCGETGNTASRIETLRSSGWLGTLVVAVLTTILGYGLHGRDYRAVDSVWLATAR